ncbi:MAG: hypothetical protein QOK14_1891 [Frankiaceae bacterium]|jgi:hypothetical protein|nr:hypothetical protein [Frankiaceae bacterium]
MSKRVLQYAGAIVTILCIAAAPAPASTQPSVTAGGGDLLPAQFGEFAGDRVQLDVTAHQRPDGSPQGRFSYVHHNAPGVLARGSGIVTCLTVNADRAVVTGVITEGAFRGGGDPSGEIATFTLVNNGTTDVAGFAFSFRDGPLVPCAPGPTFLVLSQGSITVRG